MKKLIFLSSVFCIMLGIWGSAQTATTKMDFPQVMTRSIFDITSKSAVVTGQVISEGGSIVKERGICFGTAPHPTTGIPVAGNGTGDFSATLKSLSEKTKYYVRAYATNNAGIAYGMEIILLTKRFDEPVPTVKTLTFSFLTPSSLYISANISHEEGEITERGICYNTSGNPQVTDKKINKSKGTGNFKAIIPQLERATTYYIRPYAVNYSGIIAYAQELVITTGSTVSDVDGNVYATMIADKQEWMAENLRTAHYQNGDPVLSNLSREEWRYSKKGGYAVYDDDTSNNRTYGKLYNWKAVMDKRQLCPAGWHLPSLQEMFQLVETLGPTGTSQALKAGSRLWDMPDVSLLQYNNSSGFFALPAGMKSRDFSFTGLHRSTLFWSSTYDDPSGNAYALLVNLADNPRIDLQDLSFGFSCRCVKN